MRTIDMTTTDRFQLKDPETKVNSTFLGKKSHAREDYLTWNDANPNRPIEQGFFYWCTVNLAIIHK